MTNELDVTNIKSACPSALPPGRMGKDLELAQRCARLISMIQEQRYDPYVRGWEKSEFFSLGEFDGAFRGRPSRWSEEVKVLVDCDLLQVSRSQTEDHYVARILPRQKTGVERLMQWYMAAIQ